MSGHRKWSELRVKVMERPGAAERVERARAEFEEELRLYELRHAEALSQVEVAGRLEITQSAWRLRFFALGRSTSGRNAVDADEMLAEGFGRG